MSIVRVGLAETKNFAEGYEAIFGKKQETTDGKKDAPSAQKPSAPKKKVAPKKKK